MQLFCIADVNCPPVELKRFGDFTKIFFNYENIFMSSLPDDKKKKS